MPVVVAGTHAEQGEVGGEQRRKPCVLAARAVVRHDDNVDALERRRIRHPPGQAHLTGARGQQSLTFSLEVTQSRDRQSRGPQEERQAQVVHRRAVGTACPRHGIAARSHDVPPDRAGRPRGCL